MRSKYKQKNASKIKSVVLKSLSVSESALSIEMPAPVAQEQNNAVYKFDLRELIRCRLATKCQPNNAILTLKYGAQILSKGDIDLAFEESENAYKLNPNDGTTCLMWLKTGLLSGKPVAEQSSWLPLIDSDGDVKQIAAHILERASAHNDIGLAYFSWASSSTQIEYLLWSSQSGEVSYDVQADAHCSTTGLLRVKPGLSRFHKPAPAHDSALKILIGNIPPINKDVFVPVDMAEVEVAARARQANMALTQDKGSDVAFDATVDVIIPAYRDARMTVECIQSVLVAKSNTPVHVIVIDDASPEPEVSEALRRIAAMGKIELIVNRRNLGFVGSVNLGMSQHPSRHPVLLNSDTLVYDGWIDEAL